MAKLNFPDPSASPFNADNGVIYVWVDQGGGKGYWSGSAELTSENLDAVFVEVNGDNMTGNLSLGGASNLLLDASLGKIIGQSTADTDPAGTLVTKDYIDNNVLSDDFLSLKADAGDQIVLSPDDTSFTGNVGIGTSGFDNLGAVYSPSLGLKGTTGSRLGLWGNGGRWWYAQTETSNKFILGTRITGNAVDKSLVTVATDGHVGIGTNAPNTNLQIDDVTPELRINSTDGTLRRMSFTGPGSNTWQLKSFGLDATYNNSFEIAQGNDSRLFLQSGGNVGIGTDNPQVKLDVMTGGSGGYGRIKLAEGSTVSATIEAIRSAGDIVSVNAFEATTDDGNCFNIDYSGGAYFKGKVGIGTDDPTVKLNIVDETSEYSYFDHKNIDPAGGIVWRHIIRNIADTANVSNDIASLKGGGFAINLNDTDANNYLTFGIGGTRRLTVLANGNVGIGTDVPQANLEVNADPNGSTDVEIARLRIQGDTKNPMLRLLGNEEGNLITVATSGSTSDSELQINTTSTAAVRIDKDGNVLQGTDTARTGLKFGGTSVTPLSQIEKLDGTASLSIVRNSNNTNGSTLYLGKSRGGSNGSATTVTQGDRIGSVSFNGADGSSLAQAARIDTEVDGTVSEGSVPGRLVFFTTSAGETGPREKMRIRSNGNVGIGTSTPSKKLEVGENVSGTLGGVIKISNRVNVAPGTQAALELQPNNNDDRAASIVGEQDTESSTKVNLIFNTPDSALPQERMRITHDGKVGIGTDTPQAKLDVNGTIKATSIQFPGSSSTLDDYEEGTFTPSFGGSVSNPTGTYNTNSGGIYRKIGNTVFCQLRMRFDCTSIGSGNLVIRGLPFTAVNSLTRGCVSLGSLTVFSTSSTNGAPRSGILTNSTTVITMTTLDLSTGLTKTCDVDALQLNGGGGTSTGSNNIEMNITYMTD